MRAGQSKLDVMKRKIKRMQEELQAEFKVALETAIEEFFITHPKVKSFSWSAYTPYFNDGDACYFSYNSLLWHDAEIEGKDDVVAPDDSSGWFNTTTEGKAALKDLKIIDDMLSTFQDSLESLYGDHVQVTATASGLHIDEYEHD